MANDALKKFLQWGSHHSRLFVFSARQFAVTSAQVADYFNALHNETFSWPYAPPPLAEWLSYYRNHRKLECELCHAMLPKDSCPELIYIGWHGARNLALLSPEKRRKVAEKVAQDPDSLEIIREVEPYVRNLLNFLDRDALSEITEVKSDTQDQAVIPRGVQSPALFFLVHVVLPCLTIYNTVPFALYRKARHGNLEALGKLACIDKSIIYDSHISEMLHQLSYEDRKRYREKFAPNLSKRLPRISKKKIKITYAALISLFPEKETVTTPEIRALYDSVSSITDNQLIDTDLPESKETYYKAIQRARSEWMQGLNLPKP